MDIAMRWVLLLLLSINVSAQTSFTVSGTVRTGSEPASGATVRLGNKQLACNDNGYFRLKVDSGSYLMEVTLTGYTAWSETIVVNGNRVLDIDLKLAAKELTA